MHGWGLRDHWLTGWFSPGGYETWYWNFGRDSSVLGRGSCEGSCLGWYRVVWGWVWLCGGAMGRLGELGGPFLSESSRLVWTGRWFYNLGRDSPVLGRGSREGSHIGWWKVK